jgi:hypothetical protein
MPDPLDIVLQLRAIEGGRAVARATHRRIAVQPHARVICTVAMAAENATIHIAAIGRAGRPPKIRSVPDPRDREGQYALFRWLGWNIERYVESCRRTGTYPQFWVPSLGAAQHLDLLSERFRFNSGDPDVERFGTLLAYACDRLPVAGQQALIPATCALRTHFATGQQSGEDEHLGALLAWIDPPPGPDVYTVLQSAEDQPMGHRTRPEFDRDVLAPLISEYATARRSATSEDVVRECSRAIHVALEGVVMPIFSGVQRAIEHLLRAFPPLSELDRLERRELEEFDSFMRGRDAGYRVPLRDGPKAAAFKLSAREDAQEIVEAAVLHGDRIARARAILAGRAVVGTVERSSEVRVAPRRREFHFEIVSEQTALRVRANDELTSLVDARFAARVLAIHREGARSTRISLILTRGQRAVGVPRHGETLVLGPAAPDWDALWRERRKLRDRLAIEPWTHRSRLDVPSRTPSGAVVSDPLAEVEALQ